MMNAEGTELRHTAANEKGSTRSGRVTRLAHLVRRLPQWFDRNARDLPWRRTFDPYAIWVSEIMLQQTQVKTVIPYWENWMRELPTIGALAKAKPERVLKLWEGLGYYHRAHNLQKAAQWIVERHEGKFPDALDEVLALPGIGRYTAGAICSIAFNQPRPILDGNVIRVLARVFFVRGDPREKTVNQKLWRVAEELVLEASAMGKAWTNGKRSNPEQSRSAAGICSQFNQALMELGALICTAREPKCARCPVQSVCGANRSGSVAALPNLGRRPRHTARRFLAFVVEHRGRFLIRQRLSGVVNAHLWEFPNVEVTGSRVDHAEASRSIFRTGDLSPTPLCTIKHSITRYRITLEAFRARVQRRPLPGSASERWCRLKEIAGRALASAHRKILQRLLESDGSG